MLEIVDGNVLDAVQIVEQGLAVLVIENANVGPPGLDGDAGTGGSAATPAQTTSGTASAFTAAFGLTALPAADAPRLVVITFHTAPNATATLNPDGLGALPLRTPANAAIGAGAVTSGITLPALIWSDRVQLLVL